MLKVRKNFLYLLLVSLLTNNILSEEDPYIFIDKNAQQMVVVLIENKSLFLDDRSAYEDKIKEIFEPMIDFKRVSAGVMGRQHYMKASPDQRNKFVDVFRNSLLDTYSETLAQWENQDIDTIFPETRDFIDKKSIEVRQILNTGSSKYPISYKLRKNKDGSWMIINIIVNGVNLGLTFKNQFQALAIKNNGDIEKTLNGWVSDAGDAGISG
ncbi:ABC transporter substrate-binding protein [Gammaproteobacteria bacterium]|nr:ABC transporter substrate-binding protein [Gammaproteobacteria bacterium]